MCSKPIKIKKNFNISKKNWLKLTLNSKHQFYNNNIKSFKIYIIISRQYNINFEYNTWNRN